ncbi:MAG TPA: AAA family ATPase [Bryobacterales bacterium]|nr:AAA family ATPase [Bryobacterales bacterium]
MATLAVTPQTFKPRNPVTLQDAGLNQNLLIDLMLKLTLLEGVTTLGRLASQMKVSMTIMSQLFSYFRREQLCEVKGMAGNDYELTLSAAGRKVAQDRYAINQYIGPAPVKLNDYCQAVKEQSAHHPVTRSMLNEVFFDLVLPDVMLDQLGPAILSNTTIFLYGPTGNGKTSIAERLVRIFKDYVYIPYAIEVEGQIINIFDSVVHQALESQEDDTDPRWILCRRPCIAVGGELVPEMLELRFDETLGFYSAPLQMKANNGLFIIDDFGRQMINPRDLLNRWIVPLDRRVDFLSLRTGVKFPIPFETLVVFSTNLDPRQLADEAFLRRIQNKIKIDTITPEIFDNILRRVCEEYQVEFDPDVARYLREKCNPDGKGVLRACYPRDMLRILQSIADYENRAPELSERDLDRALNLYFAKT